MSPTESRRPWTGWIVVLGAVLACAGLRSHARAVAADPVETTLQVPDVPAWFVRLLALGFDSAAADTSYLRAIQIFGEPASGRTTHDQRLKRSDAIARLLERTTDLDPSFAYAYVFGAVAIPVPSDRGTVGNLVAAESLLRKGTEAVPSDWRIPFHLAYLKAVQEGDFTSAAGYMGVAALRPNAPKYLTLLATRLAAQGGSLDTGIAIARARLSLAASPEERAEIEGRLLLLVMERDLRALESAVAAYVEHHGLAPPSLEALVADARLPSVPDEPHGGRYQLDAQGRVSSSAAARLRLPKHALDEIEAGRRFTVDPPTPAPPPETPKSPDGSATGAKPR